MKNIQNRFAFTLAEVLITLAIIGVVAAMTIPTLVAKVQNKELETAFKKNYSVIQNAYEKAFDDNGSKGLDLNSKTDVDLLFSNLNIISSDNLPAHWALVFDKASNVQSWNVRFLFASQAAWIGSYHISEVLADGSYIGIYSFNGGGGAGNLVVDTNGAKGPNRLGYDIFLYTSRKADGLFSRNVANTSKLSSAGYTWIVAPEDGVDPKGCEPASFGADNSSGDNGTNCTYYALANQCPWDSTKTYWASLP